MTAPAHPVAALHKAWTDVTKKNKEEHKQRITHLHKELLIGAALAIVGIASTIFLGYIVLGVALIGVGCVLARNAWKQRKSCIEQQAPTDKITKLINDALADLQKKTT